MSDDVIAPPAIDLALARKVLQTEAAAIQALVDRLGEPFERAVRLLLDCRGRVIVTGMGKSGIICRKIAATLSSTGTPAFFLHPAEAIHGDLGVLQPEDVIVSLDGKPVGYVAELQAKIAEHRPGERVELEVFRDGRRTTVTVRLDEAPINEAPVTTASRSVLAEERLGINVEAIDAAQARELGFDGPGVVPLAGQAG